MRKLSTLVGLTLLVLAPTARAEEAAPKPATLEPPSAPAPAASGVNGPATAPPVAEQDVASKSAQPTATNRKLQVGLSFLPMGMGKYTYRPDSTSALVKSDAYFAYGAALSASYEVIPNLLVGLAPQLIYNVQEKTPQVWAEAVSEIDILARVAYAYPVVEAVKVYAEFLPGYSLIRNSAGSAGLVLAFGAGFTMDFTERFFANVAGGYQIGFQKWANGATSLESQTRYIRVALGAGVKF